ncbi:MAG: type II toxin-antitoxin system ParD family antitoxin, partial [Psychrosphaera sp.]|nr:type II toxin-antitoxin system ParD family antitoxin [Psychrosphaera sp.]
MANVTLGDRYESYVKELVESGRYNSVSEVVRSGLRLLEEEVKGTQFRLERLQLEIQKGLDSGN